jgi:hypothetical protein
MTRTAHAQSSLANAGGSESALIAAIRPRDAWFRVACALACYAGLRRGEVASLRRPHIGMERAPTKTTTLALCSVATKWQRGRPNPIRCRIS